jgi:NAD(P)-dependent dehydrogenase (short-subunit alcohol dehydrogenase family)
MSQLQDRVALITGGASGIGGACALRFAREGAQVVSLDLNEPDPSFWKQVAGAAPKSFFETCDVRDETRIREVVAQTVERLGSLDVVVNAAGVPGGGPVHALDADAWDHVLDVNLKGTYLVCKHALGPMLEQGSGSIINIASIEGLEGAEGGSAYNASKGGVVLLTKQMSMDYARRGIRVNAVCPGFIETPMLQGVFEADVMKPSLERVLEHCQLGRLGRPEEIAAGALFLASDDASFVTGHSLVIDGGFTAGHRLGTGALLGLS